MSQRGQSPTSGKPLAPDPDPQALGPAPEPAADDTAAPEAPARPDPQERRAWQDELRRHADARSCGSDESPANGAEPAPGAGTGLHGGLVR